MKVAGKNLNFHICEIQSRLIYCKAPKQAKLVYCNTRGDPTTVTIDGQMWGLGERSGLVTDECRALQ